MRPVPSTRAIAEGPSSDACASAQVLLNCDAESKQHAYYHVAACDHSANHALLAYAEDTNGSEIYTLRVRRLHDGANLADEVPGVTGSFCWANDNEHLFYTVLDDNHRPSKVMRHRLGTPVDTDVRVYEEPDPGFFVGLDMTESRRFILIDSHDHTTSEVRLIDAFAPCSEPVMVAERERDLEYSVSHHGDNLVILTNADGAEDFKLMLSPLGSTTRSSWRDAVPHRAGVLLVGFTVFKDHLVRVERVDAIPRMVVRRWSDGQEHAVAFDESVFAAGVVGCYEFDTHTLRFSYSSPTTPSRVFDYNMESRERTLRKVQEVPSGHLPTNYRAQRQYALSHDGERVPVTLLYRYDTPLDGTAPVLLYGYGAYGHSIPASFSTARLSLVDRGFIYAIAHVRGGTECGYNWYRGGKLARKVNTFHDFIAAAEKLIADGLTEPGRIACHGASAGGMLVGAVTNMRPDLFGATVGEVPFVDVLTTMCDADLPLTPPEWPEWGNPLEDPEAFANIRAYSPYDNVEAKAYPHILATAGLTDPRVTYWEPAKWVARLRERRTDNGSTLLKTNMSAGHGGAAGRFERLEETALVYAFVLDVLGAACAKTGPAG